MQPHLRTGDASQVRSESARQKVCHSVSNASLISHMTDPGGDRDVALLHVIIFFTSRGHCVFSGSDVEKSKRGEKNVVIRMQQG